MKSRCDRAVDSSIALSFKVDNYADQTIVLRMAASAHGREGTVFSFR